MPSKRHFAARDEDRWHNPQWRTTLGPVEHVSHQSEFCASTSRNPMRPAGLDDTGAIIAIIDASASHIRTAWKPWRLENAAITTEAVLTELFHLIRARHLRMDKACSSFDQAR